MMLIRSLIETALDKNAEFELNDVDIRYSTYQVIALASSAASLPITKLDQKNKLYLLYKKQRGGKQLDIKNLNLNLLLTKITNQDKAIINVALTDLPTQFESQQNVNKKKRLGVVAVFYHDYL